LHSIADAERRNAKAEDGLVAVRRSLFVDAIGTPGKDHAPNARPGELPRGDGVRQDLAVHGELAEAARDELGVLGAKVENEDGIVSHVTSMKIAPDEAGIIVFAGGVDNNLWSPF
jgi:hypothetical protein